MSMYVEVLGVITALVSLYFGAEFTLSNAEKIGKALGLSALTIGVLIIGFGTSLPEFFVSQIAAANGKTDLALGNLIGSNIANSLLILGIATLFTSIPVKGRSTWFQIAFHLVLHCSLYFLLVPPELALWAKCVLLGMFVSYIIFSIINDKKKICDEDNTKDSDVEFKFKNLFFLVIGVVLLFVGGELLVSQGSSLGKNLGVSEYFISVIFISFGTSFPELVTSVMACVRKKDISLVLGNILGSNFFNLSFVLGSILTAPVVVKTSGMLEVKVLIGISFLFVLFGLIKRIPRLFSIFLLSGYGAMIYYWGISS